MKTNEELLLIKKAKVFDLLVKNFNIRIEDTMNDKTKIVKIYDSEFYDSVSEVYSTNDAILIKYILKVVHK